MPNGTDLQLYIQRGKEERYLEYKRSMIWTGNDTTKVKIAKAMMAMANLSNGGSYAGTTTGIPPWLQTDLRRRARTARPRPRFRFAALPNDMGRSPP